MEEYYLDLAVELERLRKDEPSSEVSQRIEQIEGELASEEEQERQEQGITGDPEIDAWMDEVGRVVDDDDWKDVKVDP